MPLDLFVRDELKIYPCIGCRRNVMELEYDIQVFVLSTTQVAWVKKEREILLIQ
jgi:hypothetical protein